MPASSQLRDGETFLFDRCNERSEVTVRLPGRSGGETGGGLVHIFTLAERAGNDCGIARLRMREGEGPAAKFALVRKTPGARRARVEFPTALHIAELPHEKVAAVGSDSPTEKNVGRARDHALIHHHALSLAFPWRGVGIGRQNRRLRFLVLQQDGVVVIVAGQGNDPAAGPDASHSRDFPSHIHHPVAGKEWFPIIGQRLDVLSGRFRDHLRDGTTVCRISLPHDEGFDLYDVVLVVDEFGSILSRI